MVLPLWPLVVNMTEFNDGYDYESNGMAHVKV